MAIANITNNILTDSGISTSSLLTGTGTTNYITKYTGTSTIGNSLIYDNGTSLGIGTASPSYLLDVQTSAVTQARFRGSSTDAAIIRLENSTSSQTYSIGAAGSNNLGGAPNNSFYVRDETASAVRLAITSGGNVGINTGSSTLNAYLTSYTTSAANQIKAAGTAPAITFSDGISTSTYAGVVGVATAANHFVTGTAAGDMAIANQSATAGAIVFGTGTTERMRMTSAGTFSIGNTNTTYNLDVTGTGRFTGNVILSSGSGNKIAKLGGSPTASDGASLEFIPSNNTTNWAIRTNWNVGGALEFSPSSAAGGSTFTTPSMLITSGGNVGIGTSSPLLTTANRTTVDISGTSTSLLVLSTGATWKSYIYNDGTNLTLTNNSGVITFETSGSERMRITSGGAVNFNGASIYTAAGCINTTVSSTSDFMFNGINSNATNPRGVYIRHSNSTGGDYAYYLEASGAAKFYVNGNGVIYSTNTSVQAISDVRHKENIRDIDKGLYEVLSLKPRLFDWKEGKGTGNKDVMGFVAQEVEKIFPELISDWKENVDATETFKSIAMTNMIPYLVKAIQEQNQLIQKLRTDIELLKNK